MVDVLETLIVDDDDSILDIFNSLFRYFDVPCKTFLNPLDALDYTKKNKDKGVLLGMGFFDYSMPEMNGYELANEIKVIDPKIPLVLVSGGGVIEDYLIFSAFSDVQKKPFFISDIQRALAKYHRNSSILRDKLIK